MSDSIAQALSLASSSTAGILERALAGRDLTGDDIEALLPAAGADQAALIAVADQLRRGAMGDDVTYVVNRNINFTNVCVKKCGFCAFSRTYRNSEGYFLPIEEIVRRAEEAARFGASEVCVQAGLAPGMKGDFYIQICRAIREAAPELHIHACSPEEVLYGSRLLEIPIRDFLARLREAGLGSLPGTSAEILVQSVRDRLAPGRISVDEWFRVIGAAHELGIPTTSTMMFGHLENPAEIAQHLLALRDRQRRSGGFTEFVPLGFVHQEAPMFHRKSRGGLRPGPTRDEVLNVHAASRLVLNRDIPNLQVSWVKMGFALAVECLKAGANDLGGTLMNESISTAAGASHGQFARPRELRHWIRSANRTPAERTTLYRIRRRFEADGSGEEALDVLGDPSVFGSYTNLIKDRNFRFFDSLRSQTRNSTPEIPPELQRSVPQEIGYRPRDALSRWQEVARSGDPVRQSIRPTSPVKKCLGGLSVQKTGGPS